MRKIILLLYLFIPMYLLAQTDFYYYKGKKVPLFKNDNKVCVSIPKDNRKASERFLTNVKVQERMKDESFDIYVILRSDMENLNSIDLWKEDAKNIIVTPSYSTTDKVEVFATPYLNIRLKKEEDIDLLNTYAEQYGLKIIRQDPLMPLWYIVAITQDCNINTVECANLLWESGKFAASVPDLSANDLICSNDPMFNQQWGLYNSSYPDIDISVTSAWNYSTGKSIKIANSLVIPKGFFLEKYK